MAEIKEIEGIEMGQLVNLLRWFHLLITLTNKLYLKQKLQWNFTIKKS